MPVNLMPLVCPKCGGQLHIPSDAKEVFCSFCGTQIAIDDGAVTVHVHNYDEAELKRLELEQKRREEEERKRVEQERTARELQERERSKREEHRKKWRMALIAYIVILFALSGIANLVEESVPAIYSFITTALGFVALVGGIALYLQRPGKADKRKE